MRDWRAEQAAARAGLAAALRRLVELAGEVRGRGDRDLAAELESVARQIAPAVNQRRAPRVP